MYEVNCHSKSSSLPVVSSQSTYAVGAVEELCASTQDLEQIVLVFEFGSEKTTSWLVSEWFWSGRSRQDEQESDRFQAVLESTKDCE